MDFLIATHNAKKCAELQRILAPLGVRVKTAGELGMALTDVEETGDTFEENARLKAVSGCAESGMPCVADDSGLMVDALGGAPGVYSARYAGVHGDDRRNNAKLLEALDGLPAEQRAARFVSVVCCRFPNGDEVMARGECHGMIAFAPRGDGGFGYDPLFLLPDGRCFGEISAQEKDAVSHRGNALRTLREKLEAYFK